MGEGKSGGVADGFTDSTGGAGPSATPGRDGAASAAEGNSGGVRTPMSEEAVDEV